METARLPGPESRLGMGSTQRRRREVATLFRSYYHRHFDGQPPAINWTWRPTSPSIFARVLREGIPSSVCHQSWSRGSVLSLVRCALRCGKRYCSLTADFLCRLGSAGDWLCCLKPILSSGRLRIARQAAMAKGVEKLCEGAWLEVGLGRPSWFMSGSGGCVREKVGEGRYRSRSARTGGQNTTPN